MVERAEILPFHQLGHLKCERLGLDYSPAETEPPTAESIAAAVGIFRVTGLQAA